MGGGVLWAAGKDRLEMPLGLLPAFELHRHHGPS